MFDNYFWFYSRPEKRKSEGKSLSFFTFGEIIKNKTVISNFRSYAIR